jgi:hypothetical protein
MMIFVGACIKCGEASVNGGECCRCYAKAIEAQRAETAQTGSVADESAAPKGFARKDQR